MPGADPSGLHVQRALHLRTFPAFAQLSPETLAMLAEPCEDRSFVAGETILDPGQPAPALHFIIDGEVEVRDGAKVARRMHGREAVGGLAVLTERPAHAVASQPTYTLALAKSDLFEVFADHPEIRTAVIRALARTLVNRLRARAAGGEAVNLPFETGPEPELGPSPSGAGLDVAHLFALFRAFAFAGATVTATADLTREAQTERLEAGAPLWALGDPAGRLWVPTQGTLVATTDAGDQFRLGPGAVLGALDALGAVPRWTFAEAETAVEGLVLTADAVLDTAEDHPNFAYGLIRALARAVQR